MVGRDRAEDQGQSDGRKRTRYETSAAETSKTTASGIQAAVQGTETSSSRDFPSGLPPSTPTTRMDPSTARGTVWNRHAATIMEARVSRPRTVQSTVPFPCTQHRPMVGPTRCRPTTPSCSQHVRSPRSRCARSLYMYSTRCNDEATKTRFTPVRRELQGAEVIDRYAHEAFCFQIFYSETSGNVSLLSLLLHCPSYRLKTLCAALSAAYS